MSLPAVPGMTFVVGGASVEGSGGIRMTVSQRVSGSRVGRVLLDVDGVAAGAAVDDVAVAVGDADDVAARCRR